MRCYASGQLQSAPQRQVSPHWQPALRFDFFPWQPHVQLAPAQDPQEQVLGFFDIGSSSETG